MVEEKGLAQISDSDELGRMVDQIIAAHPKPAGEFREGKDAVLGFLMGQVMRATRGKANPQLVADMFRKKLRGE